MDAPSVVQAPPTLFPAPLRATRSVDVRALWLEHAPALVLVGVHVSARTAAWIATGIEQLSPAGSYTVIASYGSSLVIWAALFVIYYACRATLVDRTHGGFLAASAWRAFGSLYLGPQRLAGALLALVLYMLALDSFVAFKRAIPSIRPFSFDARFTELDRALHFGVDPWRILHPVLGTPAVSFALQAVYTVGWFMLLAGALFLMAWHPDRRLRARFFVAKFAVWVVLGNVLATLFSSGGPCYLEAFTGRRDFAPLLEYLGTATPGIVALQELLLRGHLEGGAAEMGISAMPSLHVATAVLFVLVARHVGRRLALGLALFAGLILVGSVHLGWHYAIDGYASMLLVPVIWWAAGRFVDWYALRTGAFDTPCGQ